MKINVHFSFVCSSSCLQLSHKYWCNIVFCTVILAAQAIILAIAIPNLTTRTYYIDPVDGNDTNIGTTPFGPLKTPNNLFVNSKKYPLTSGNTILFKCGTTSYLSAPLISNETNASLPITVSGITIGSYGEGEKPIIRGTRELNNWKAAGENIYQLQNVRLSPTMVMINNVSGERVISKKIKADGQWYWANGTLTFFSKAKVFSVEISESLSLISLLNVNEVTIQDLTLEHSLNAVTVINGDHNLIDNLTIRDSEGMAGIYGLTLDGISFDKKTIIGKLTNTTIQNTKIFNINDRGAVFASHGKNVHLDHAGSGIILYGENCRNNEITGNIIYDVKAEGIATFGGASNVISYNRSYHNGGSGIQISFPTATNNIIEHNICHGNSQANDARYGIDLIDAGTSNAIRYNEVNSRHDTVGKKLVKNNYPPITEIKTGSGGIRLLNSKFEQSEPTETTNTVYYNLIYDEYTGINLTNANNILVANNVIYNSVRYGSEEEGNYDSRGEVPPSGIKIVIANSEKNNDISQNIKLLNNIITHNDAKASLISLVNATPATIDFNLYYQNNNELFSRNGKSYNWVQWKSLTGADTNSPVPNDPLFVMVDPDNLNKKDFYLTANSPARAIGTVIEDVKRDFNQVTLVNNQKPDLGVFQYQQVAKAGRVQSR